MSYRCTLCSREILLPIASGDACPHCGGAARTRSLPVLLNEHLADLPPKALRDSLPVLVFAPLSAERAVLLNRFASLKAVTLYGGYGADVERGVDARDLSRYPDAAFAGHVSLALFDYFTEQQQALDEAWRVLAPGGIFATLILDARVRDDASAPVVTKKIEKKPGYYDYWPDGVDLLSVGVGRDWLVEAMRASGFEDARHVAIADPVSGYVAHWFVGVKPLDGKSRPAVAPPPAEPAPAATERCTICGKPFPSGITQDNCPSCNAPSRLRGLPVIWSEVVGELGFNKPLLGFAMTAAERHILAPFFPEIVSVSLYGSYGAGHIAGVDARDLSRFADGAFGCVFSILLFDYFFEHEQALAEAARVTAPGGLFITLILDSRVSDDAAKPSVMKTIAPRPGYFDYVPADKALLSVHVGQEWFLKTMRRAGFAAQCLETRDAIAPGRNRWFVGWRR
ncbi:MAG TPA: methyltransferase domain-containing protein [Rhizomicrobium sp.]|nr:methyltransferase domain-containing protein [Rhizomicrobium sp.]